MSADQTLTAFNRIAATYESVGRPSSAYFDPRGECRVGRSQFRFTFRTPQIQGIWLWNSISYNTWILWKRDHSSFWIFANFTQIARTPRAESGVVLSDNFVRLWDFGRPGSSVSCAPLFGLSRDCWTSFFQKQKRMSLNCGIE